MRGIALTFRYRLCAGQPVKDEVPAQKWSKIRQVGIEKRFLSEKEVGIIKVAEQIPQRIPSEKQSEVLLGVLEKAEAEGIL